MFSGNLTSGHGFSLVKMKDQDILLFKLKDYYHKYQQLDTETDLMEMRLFVMNYARKRFKDKGIEGTFIDFIKKDKISQYAADFLIDTARFIVSGYRTVDVSIWNNLLLVGDKKIANKSGVLNIDSSILKLKQTHQDKDKEEKLTLANWLNHRRGFEDLLYTLYILDVAEKARG